MLENFRNTLITWNSVNQPFNQVYDIIAGDVNARLLSVLITDGGNTLDLTGYTLQLYWSYKTMVSDGIAVFDVLNASQGKFQLTYPTEMTKPGIIEGNLSLIDAAGKQVMNSKTLKFIIGDSEISATAEKVNNSIDDFITMLLSQLPAELEAKFSNLDTAIAEVQTLQQNLNILDIGGII